MKDWVVAIICIFGTLGIWMLVSPDVDATPVKGCAQYNDGCWCRLTEPPYEDIKVDDGNCQESFDEEEVQMMIGWLIVIGVIYQMSNAPDPGLGILPPEDDRRWAIQSSPDGISIEYAIPF